MPRGVMNINSSRAPTPTMTSRYRRSNSENSSMRETDARDDVTAPTPTMTSRYRRSNSENSSVRETDARGDVIDHFSVTDFVIDENIESFEYVPLPSRSTVSGDSGRSEKSWWSYGSRKTGTPSSGGRSTTTHQSAKLTLTGDRMFFPPAGGGPGGGHRRSTGDEEEEVWDLSDSLAELYEHEQLKQAAKFRYVTPEAGLPERVNIESWLAADPNNGFVRVYPTVPPVGSGRPSGGLNGSRLIPCTTSTIAHKMGLIGAALHVQYSGDSTVRRLEPHDLPLVIQNDFLTGLGYNSIAALQASGVADELAYLVKFYTGKPIQDSTFCRRQLKSILNIKKVGLLQQWVQRPCAISGTRLLIYKDGVNNNDEPIIMQLVKGSVEEIKLKGHDLCLKVTSTINGEKQVLLSFSDAKLYGRWLRRCKKATDKLPTVADLSSCQLEYLPENIFVNDQLAVLNLQHNTLRERPFEDDIYAIGWLQDLAKFRNLRSLNLADNSLHYFPLSLCSITTLVHLNLSSNKIDNIPSDISALTKLQELHLHNNHLSSLPDEIINLRHLFVLILAFNEFTELHPIIARLTNNKVSDVENVILAGNQIDHLPVETLLDLRHAKKIDLRMNRLLLPLSETKHLSQLDRLTHLDVRDNHIADLDVTSVRTLEYLNCERNAMSSLFVNGTALRNLFASCNCLEHLMISPKPEWLLQIDVSDNCLELLPEWLGDCFFLQKLNASKNFLVTLPPRILTAKKLKTLRVNHNSLTTLPDEVDCQFLEELYIHHNLIIFLPRDLLQKANKLRILNATKNRLTSLPPLNANVDLNKVQELLLSGNFLDNTVLRVVSGYTRLKVLHLAQNELTELFEDEIGKLEMLYELNVSTNQLTSLPTSLCSLPKLGVIRAHSNCLCSLPDFHTAKSVRVLDVGHNQLSNISVTNLMASQISLLDMSLNTELRVDEREYRALKTKKNVCLVDLTGQNRQLPGLVKRKGALESIDEHLELDTVLPWKVGFSETSGNRNKLCITTLKLLKFNTDNDSLFGMFDGGRNADVTKLIVKNIANVLTEEMKCHEEPTDFMKYTMLTMHRKLRSTGQRLGASAVLVHIQRHTDDGQMNHFTMNVANVGDVEAVLCRQGEAMLLTRKFVATHDREECFRIRQLDGIITEDGKVNGTTVSTRQLGCAFMYPHVIPDPHVATVTLRNDDEFIVVANGALWEVLTPEDAVEEIYEIGNPVVAAKHLQDLAQGLGAQENVSVLVIRLNTDRGPSLARLRPNRQAMSVDDVEAAEAHEAAKRARAAATSLLKSAVSRRPSFPRTSVVPQVVPRIPAADPVVPTIPAADPVAPVPATTAKPRHQQASNSTPAPARRLAALPENSMRFQNSNGEEKTTKNSAAEDDGKSDISSVTSFDQVVRMNFSTDDELDLDDDDDGTLTNSSGGSDDEGLTKTGRFVQDVISIEQAPVASGFVSSTSRRYASAAAAARSADATTTSGAHKRSLPVAPKPRFAKKNSSGVDNESTNRNVTSANGVGHTTSGGYVGVARMVFNDSTSSVEENVAQRAATPYGERWKPHRTALPRSPPAVPALRKAYPLPGENTRGVTTTDILR